MSSRLTVAVPWSLSHYISINGFHPLYRPIFEHKPTEIELHAWDNVKLSRKLHGDQFFRERLLSEISRDDPGDEFESTTIKQEYASYFGLSNRSLTRLLPGDLEFLHTAPYPSLERPFIFHCESFTRSFFPFAVHGAKEVVGNEVLKSHYKAIFEHPFCLGISSHLPQTLEDISAYFGSSIIDERIFSSRIGLFSEDEVPPSVMKRSIDAPVFLFINSANQNPLNFFLRGGHIALRFWQVIYPNEEAAGKLIMRCARPSDNALSEYGVDLDWLIRHERRSVMWVEDYLSASDIKSLMREAHFFLLPSISLHSVSIMQAMSCGAVPIVSDTLGTERYVTDAVDGIVLKGVYENKWQKHCLTGVMVDHYQRDLELEKSLINQLSTRFSELIFDSNLYFKIQRAGLTKSSEDFSGKLFSDDFWLKTQERYWALPESIRKSKKNQRNQLAVKDCLLDSSDWGRVFNNPPQPVIYLDTGFRRVVQVGGCFVSISDKDMSVHDWSPLAGVSERSAPDLLFSKDIKGLAGSYLIRGSMKKYLVRHFVAFMSERLMPYPAIHKAASYFLRYLRHIRLTLNSPLLYSKDKKELNVLRPRLNIKLVKRRIKGFNIFFYENFFYAIPEEEGEFSPESLASGEYKLCISGSSLRSVLRKVDIAAAGGEG